MAEGKLIYLIAGEASGDLLGAGLMAALKRKDATIRFAGIGGERMIAEGLISLFPMSDLSVMGLAEVVSHLPRLIARINQTIADILKLKPAVVIGIDAPDFCFRVEKKIRARDPAIKLMHYVAPSVWAWRPGRAKKIAAFLDHLLALLPFEPPYFTSVGLPCTFVGHPATNLKELSSSAQAEDPSRRLSSNSFLNNNGFPACAENDKSSNIVLLLAGSRSGEVSRILPLCLEVAKGLAKNNPNLFFVFPTMSHVEPLLREGLKGFDLPHAVTTDPEEKGIAFATARAALAASGTVALELALAGVPAVICYRVKPLTAWIAHRLVKIKYAALPNLILDREIMPEFLQERARADLVLPALQALLGDTPQRQAQLSAFSQLEERLRPNGADPNAVAADAVLNLISAR